MIRHGAVLVVLLTLLSVAGGAPAASLAREKSFTDIVQENAAPVQERALRAVLTIHIWRMTEEVGLREEQAAQLFPKIREAFQVRWQAEATRRHLLRQLGRVNDSALPRSERLEQLLSQWAENQAKLYASQQAMEEAVKRVLSPMQQAKYVVFQERFHGELTRIVEEYRREQASSGGGPKGPKGR